MRDRKAQAKRELTAHLENCTAGEREARNNAETRVDTTVTTRRCMNGSGGLEARECGKVEKKDQANKSIGWMPRH